MADLRAQLRRNLDALRLVLSRDPSADVECWAGEIAELAGLTMIDLSCENLGNSRLAENRDICVIVNCREFERCLKTTTSTPWVSSDPAGKSAAN